MLLKNIKYVYINSISLLLIFIYFKIYFLKIKPTSLKVTNIKTLNLCKKIIYFILSCHFLRMENR